MDLKLKSDAFAFRRELPEDCPVLGPDGEKVVYLEIEARPGGALNPGLMADLEAIQLEESIMEKRRNVLAEKAGKDEAAAEKLEKRKHDDSRRVAEKRIAAIYDRCVISWKTNICDASDTVIEPTRGNFIALADVRIPALAQAFIDFMEQANGISMEIAKQDEETVKN